MSRSLTRARTPASSRPPTGAVRTQSLPELYARHAAACLAVARGRLGDTGEAEDAVQSAFVELARHPGPPPSDVRAWLIARTHRRAVERLRLRPRACGPSPDETPHPRLVELVPEQRAALELAYRSGCTDQEIARITGQPVDAVRRRLRGALAALHAAG